MRNGSTLRGVDESPATIDLTGLDLLRSFGLGQTRGGSQRPIIGGAGWIK